MVERYRQGDLASPVTGTPGVDKSAGVAAQIVAQTADKMKEREAAMAMQQLQGAEQDFNQSRGTFFYLQQQNNMQRKAEENRILQENIAYAKNTASTTLRNLANAIQKDHVANPGKGYAMAESQVDALLEGFVPKDQKESIQAGYRRALHAEKSQFLEGLSNWQRSQEKANSDGKFNEVVASSLLGMQKATTPQEFAERAFSFREFANQSASNSERMEKFGETMKAGASSFLSGIAQANPSQIEAALKEAGAWVGADKIAKYRDDAKQTIKTMAAEALDAEKRKNEHAETVLEGKLISTVQSALQKANTAFPQDKDIAILRQASIDVGAMSATFDAEITMLGKQIEAQPDNQVLLNRYSSLVKQKKLVETKETQLRNAVDAAGQNIRQRVELAQRRQEAEIRRTESKALLTSLATSQAELAVLRAKVDTETAALKTAKNFGDLAKFASDKMNESQKLDKELQTARAAQQKNPADKAAIQKVKEIASKQSVLAEAAVAANNAAESLKEQESRDRETRAKAKAKLYEEAGVPLYTTLLQRSRKPFAIDTDKTGRIKIEKVKLKDAHARLNQLDESVAEMSQSGLISKEQITTLQKEIAESRQKLETWAQQEGWSVGLTDLDLRRTDAYNKPITDIEKKGLALPGTPQHEKFVQKYKQELDKMEAGIYRKYDTRTAAQYIQDHAQDIANISRDKALGIWQPKPKQQTASK